METAWTRLLVGGSKKAVGCLAVLIFLPFGLIGAVVSGLVGRPAVRKPEEVVRYIRAMIDGTINDGGSGLDYDEFSSVPVADPQLYALIGRVCAAYESGNKAELIGLLNEALSLVED